MDPVINVGTLRTIIVFLFISGAMLTFVSVSINNRDLDIFHMSYIYHHNKPVAILLFSTYYILLPILVLVFINATAFNGYITFDMIKKFLSPANMGLFLLYLTIWSLYLTLMDQYLTVFKPTNVKINCILGRISKSIYCLSYLCYYVLPLYGLYLTAVYGYSLV